MQLQYKSFESFLPDTNLIGWISTYMPKLVTVAISLDFTWSSKQAFIAWHRIFEFVKVISVSATYALTIVAYNSIFLLD